MLTAKQDTEVDMEPQSAQSLGFVVPTGPITGPPPVLSDEADEKALSDVIRQKALVNVDQLNDLLVERAIQPNSSARILVDAIDANYKLAALGAKKDQGMVGGGFSIQINIPQMGGTPPHTTIIQAAPPLIDVNPVPA